MTEQPQAQLVADASLARALAGAAEAPGTSFAWTVHPLKERPWAGAGVMAAVGGLGLATGMLGGPGWGCLAVLGLVVSLHRFCFPSRFALSETEATAEYLLAKESCPWSAVRSTVLGKHGIWLIYGSGKRGRGMQLLWGRHRERVLREVERLLGARGPAA
jgi:hypothetical protein